MARTGLTHYDTLEVARTATPRQIRAAYKKLAKRYHPDLNGGDKTAEERFKDVQTAYAVLIDERKRREYDEAEWSIAVEAAPPAPAPPPVNEKAPPIWQWTPAKESRYSLERVALDVAVGLLATVVAAAPLRAQEGAHAFSAGFAVAPLVWFVAGLVISTRPGDAWRKATLVNVIGWFWMAIRLAFGAGWWIAATAGATYVAAAAGVECGRRAKRHLTDALGEDEEP